MRILAIETSCDETSVAVVSDGTTLLSLQTAGQAEYHHAFGGVVPELAARRHLEVFYPTLKSCLTKLTPRPLRAPSHNLASLELLTPQRALLQSMDAIAVTTHPGLLSSLFVGVNAAKNLAYLLQKPLIPVSHLKAHFYSLRMGSKIAYPFIGLLASGGHTILAQVKSPLEINVLGTTLDDACGECFDKIARSLELPYPGGPAIETLAKTGDPHYLTYPIFKGEDPTQPYSFSYSGLKTAVLYNSHRYLNSPALRSSSHHRTPHPKTTPPHTTIPKQHIAASFQNAALTQLVAKTVQAAYDYGIQQIGLCGGVAANLTLKTLLLQTLKKHSPSTPYQCFSPPIALCGDNAAMIGGLAYHYYQAGAICQDIFSLSPSAKSFKKHKIL